MKTTTDVLIALLIGLMVLFCGCAVMDVSKAKAIKKIGKLDQRKRELQAKHGIGTTDTVYYRDTIIIGGWETDTLVFWNTQTDTIYSAAGSIIKWEIIRLPGDSILVPYRVAIECPTDTVTISVAIPCPNVKISRWERFYSSTVLTLRRWWWIAIVVTCIYLIARFWKNIKAFIPWL